MSFKAADFSVLAYANNFTLWHYVTSANSVETDGYFNSASDMLRKNDLIIANIDTDGDAKTIFYVVTANANGAVWVAPYDSQSKFLNQQAA